ARAVSWNSPAMVRKLVLLSGYYYPKVRVDAVLTAPVALPVLGDAMRYTVAALSARATLKGAVKGMFAPLEIPTHFFDTLSREMMLRPSQIRANAEDATFMMPAAASMAARYSELQMPVTIIAGAADAVVDPEAHSKRLHEDVPNSELAILAGSGHMVHYAAADTIVEVLSDSAVNDPLVAEDSAARGMPI